MKINPDLLRQMYCEEKMSSLDIANVVGYHPRTIRRWLNECDIQTRPKGADVRPNKNQNHRKHNLEGQKINSLLVISYNGNGDYICRCLECGGKTTCKYSQLISGYRKACKCSQLKTGNKSRHWKGFGEIPHRMLSALKAGAKSRNYEFSVTIEFLWSLFIKQNRRCALSGVEIEFDTPTASLDRKDNSKGYTENNVQWVHKTINQMKWDNSQDEFIEWCRLITSRCTAA